MSRPEITQEHVALCALVARQMTARISWRQYEDMEHDALMGLYNAWRTWRGEVPFDLYARKCIRWAILRYASYEQRHHRVDSLDAPAYEDVSWADLVADTMDLAQLTEQRFTLLEVIDALRQERPMVQDAVLRTASDAELARRYGRADSGSMRQVRARFLRDFLLAHEQGRPYTSTGRDRPAVAHRARST